MNIKKYAIIALCTVMVLGCTSCKKISSDMSSNNSNASHISQTNSDLVVSDNSSSNTTSTDSKPTPNNTTSSKVENNNQSKVPVNMEEQYGFNTLKSVNYEVISDLPYGDAVYEVKSVITDKESNTLYMCEIVSDVKGITIDRTQIIVPYEFKKNNKSVKLAARHKPTGMSIDFEIKFDTWKLVFEDNFDGKQLNTKVWGDIWDTSLTAEQRDTFCFGFTKDMAFLDGKGNLVSRVYSTGEFAKDGRPLYKSSLISTKGCYESTYGYYEIRMIPHRANSIKSSFWLMAGDMGDADAPNDSSSKNGCEIDIIETLSNLNKSCQALHWDGYYNGQTKSVVNDQIETPEIFDSKYHTFAVRWTPEEFIFMIDGKVTMQDEAAGGCQVPAYVLISSHVGTWGGDITLKPGEYSDMIVDYVRIYSNDSDK